MPNLNLLYLAAASERDLVPVDVIDDPSEDINWEKYDWCGITSVSSQYNEAIALLKEIKQITPQTHVTLGGSHACALGAELLRDGWDCVVKGEAENDIANLILSKKKGFVDVGFVKEIDKLAYPYRLAINLRKYEYNICGRNSTTILSQRSCTYGRCAFCSRVEGSPRHHSTEYVIGELKEIKKLNYSALTFFDSCFFSSEERDGEIIEELGIMGFLWRCIARANHVIKNKEIVELAGKCGCVEVAFGTESGSDTVLKTIRKGTTVEQNLRAFDICRRANIPIKVNIILGLPSESQETMLETERFLEKVQAEWVDINCLSPLPGSDIYNRPEKYDIKFEKDACLPFKMIPEQYKCGISTSKLSSEEIVKFRDYLEKKFRKGKVPQ